MKLTKVLVAKLKGAITTPLAIDAKLTRMAERIDEMKINQGVGLATLNETKTSKSLKAYEFKVFSQWGEDGIIQHLTNAVEIRHKTFIEFGVQNFFESNCRFLMMKDNWRGFVIDRSSAHIETLRNSYFYWKYYLPAVAAFITRENINDLLAQSGFDADLGILSIDIDGNDYHVLEAISAVTPRILIAEYNPIFGGERKITIPYEPDFDRSRRHYSTLYFGASLAAITHLANKRGYDLVGTTSVGGNAFFVRRDLMAKNLQAVTAEQAYFPSNIRASRGQDGQLNYLNNQAKLDLIKGMPVLNIETNAIEEL